MGLGTILVILVIFLLLLERSRIRHSSRHFNRLHGKISQHQFHMLSVALIGSNDILRSFSQFGSSSWIAHHHHPPGDHQIYVEPHLARREPPGSWRVTLAISANTIPQLPRQPGVCSRRAKWAGRRIALSLQRSFLITDNDQA